MTKQKMVCLSDIEAEIGNSVTMYGHAITRGGTKVTITPSPTPVVWVPQAPAVGGESSIDSSRCSADTLGAFLPSHDGTGGFPKYAGMVRGVFEVRAKVCKEDTSSGAPAYAIEPVTTPGVCALWIVLLKKVEVPGNNFVCVVSNVLD